MVRLTFQLRPQTSLRDIETVRVFAWSHGIYFKVNPLTLRLTLGPGPNLAYLLREIHQSGMLSRHGEV